MIIITIRIEEEIRVLCALSIHYYRKMNPILYDFFIASSLAFVHLQYSLGGWTEFPIFAASIVRYILKYAS